MYRLPPDTFAHARRAAPSGFGDGTRIRLDEAVAMARS